MGDLILGSELGKKLCEALKISPERVAGIHIDAYVNGVAKVKIERYADISEASDIESVFVEEEYRLAEKKE